MGKTTEGHPVYTNIYTNMYTRRRGQADGWRNRG